tara:strand:+ start:116 stop:328 length:213 start_codon:yes stop_codon:yes gene_type:complete
MTPDQIKAKIGVDGINVREGDTGEFYWVSLTREVRGHKHSRSVRLMKEPSPEQMAKAKDAFNVWWAEEQE